MVRVGEQIGMHIAAAIAHAPLKYEMADHRPGCRDVVAVEECQQRWDVFPLLYSFRPIPVASYQ